MEERMLERAKTSGRSDDNPETIKKRLDTFTNTTKPIIEYFSK
jgi:adenylate kinase family enzyme